MKAKTLAVAVVTLLSSLATGVAGFPSLNWRDLAKGSTKKSQVIFYFADAGCVNPVISIDQGGKKPKNLYSCMAWVRGYLWMGVIVPPGTHRFLFSAGTMQERPFEVLSIENMSVVVNIHAVCHGRIANRNGSGSTILFDVETIVEGEVPMASHTQASELLLSALASPQRGVRWQAIKEAVKRNDKQALPLLEKLAESDSEEVIRSDAQHALKSLRGTAR